MAEQTYLGGQFLIAMPALKDPNFAHTVSFVCEHSEQGALGIVINRPSDIALGEIFRQLDLKAVEPRLEARPVYNGGPVQQDRGFVIHDGGDEWDSSLQVAVGLCVTTSRDILTAIAAGEGPPRSLIALGYAGWGAGQLEREIAENAWLSVPADPAIIFELPVEKRYAASARLLGVDLSLLSTESGHA